MPLPLFWFFLPLHAVVLAFFILYLSLRGQARAIGGAVMDAALGMPKTLRKRRAIQQGRKIKSSELLRVMSTGIIEPFQELMKRNNK
jgi:hypothetical protein